MNTSDLVKAVATQANLKPSQATQVVKALFDTIMQTTAEGEDVRLIGFGTFTRAERSARTGRNPKTGATLKIPATKVPKFRPGKEYREVVAR